VHELFVKPLVYLALFAGVFLLGSVVVLALVDDVELVVLAHDLLILMMEFAFA
jgi:hypothetical protein